MKKSYIPNLFTFINLALGVMSIIKSHEGDFMVAAVFVIAAGIVDRYDGKIARMLQAESSIGKELDSLADNVSFGVAPAILVYLKYDLKNYIFLGLLIVLVYVICGCYRLAKYNSTEFDGVYHGIPITLSGSLLVVFSLLMKQPKTADVTSFIMVIVMLCLAYLMISRLSVKKR